ncbi:MAG: HD domain-containing protein [Planctomycetes bacterium]|nr:HD domain-containing protein [Planctomycetota bacterium]
MSASISEKLAEQLASPPSRIQKQLQTLLQVSMALGTIQNTKDLMGRIMGHVTAAFDADRSSLFVHDPSHHQLLSCVAQGMESAAEPIRIADHQGMVGRVFQTHEPFVLSDTFESPMFDRHLAERMGYVPRSMMVVPVYHRPGRCDGVLEVMDRRVGYFTEDDLPLIEAIAVQVSISLDNARLYDAQRRQFDSFVRAFSTAIEMRDPITGTHSLNVANYAMGLAWHMGLPVPQIEWIRIAGLLHDVGKIGVPEAVLTKPGKLSDEEFAQIKDHAAKSRRILSRIEFTDELRGLDFIAAAHHEKLDGSGYPDGLVGEEIPLKARVLAVADIFDALTQQRHYREGMSIEKAFCIIDDMTPHQLDPACVAALKRFMGVSA